MTPHEGWSPEPDPEERERRRRQFVLTIQVMMHRVCFSKGQSCGAFAVIFEIQAIRFRSGDQHPQGKRMKFLSLARA